MEPTRTVPWTVTPSIDRMTGEISIATEIAGRVTRQIIQTQEAAIREALIALGWTPPPAQETPNG